MVDQRRHQRTPIDVPVEFAAHGSSDKGSSDKGHGRAKDVSIGGMFVETSTPMPFSSEVVLTLVRAGGSRPVLLQGVVRWTNASGMGVQFGLLGARETHALTELAAGRERIGSSGA